MENDRKNRVKDSHALMLDQVLSNFIDNCTPEQLEKMESGEKDSAFQEKILTVYIETFSASVAEDGLLKMSKAIESNPADVAPGMFQSGNSHGC